MNKITDFKPGQLISVDFHTKNMEDEGTTSETITFKLTEIFAHKAYASIVGGSDDGTVVSLSPWELAFAKAL
jgi:hypothetical protein